MHDAVELFDGGIPKTRCFKDKEKVRPCKYVYAELTNFSHPNYKNFTQSFFSGNFHGDEVVGPNVITYLAKYILERPRFDLLSYNFIVLLPFGNPSGYYLNRRDEY